MISPENEVVCYSSSFYIWFIYVYFKVFHDTNLCFDFLKLILKHITLNTLTARWARG